MNSFKTTSALFLLFFAFNIQAQVETKVTTKYTLASTLGVGAGLDYGGIGANLLYYPTAKLGVFGGFGYAFAGVGYNFGAKFRLIANKEFPKINPYLTAMYGYNAAIAVKDATQFNKIFYGPTVGAGIDFNPNSAKKSGYWSLAILVPIRSSEVDKYFDYLKYSKGIKFENELFPIAISLGYRFKLN